MSCAPADAPGGGGETREIGPGLVAGEPSSEAVAGARGTPVVEALDLGVVRGVHLTLRGTSDGAEVVDGSGAVVVGPTAPWEHAPRAVGATGTVGGEAFVQVGAVPGCADADSPRECVIGDEELADVERLLEQPPA